MEMLCEAKGTLMRVFYLCVVCCMCIFFKTPFHAICWIVGTLDKLVDFYMIYLPNEQSIHANGCNYHISPEDNAKMRRDVTRPSYYGRVENRSTN
jgi:hypothetical protein